MVFQRKKTEKSTALSVRAIAAQVILQVLDQGKSLSTLLPEVQSQVKPQDLPLLQEITFGICRVLPRLENIIKKLLSDDADNRYNQEKVRNHALSDK